MIMNELLHLQYHDYLHLQYDLRIRSSISNSIENVYQYVTSIFDLQNSIVRRNQNIALLLLNIALLYHVLTDNAQKNKNA